MFKHFCRSLILVLVTLFMSGLLRGQDNFIGVRGGVSIPRLSSSSDVEITKDYRSRTAANFGAFIELGINKKVSFQTEVDYAGHGGTRNGLQPIPFALPGLPALPAGVYFYADFKNKAILHYLEIPALIKLRFGSPMGKTRFYINGGVFSGRLLNAKSVTSGSSSIYVDKKLTPLLIPPANQPMPPISFDATTKTDNDINKNNFGLAGGGGLELPTGKNYFFVEARVSYGLTHIQKDTVRNGTSHTGNLLISVGYAFKLK